MRLLRVGPPGHERPAALDDAGVLRDLSAIVDDVDAVFLADPLGLVAVRHAVAHGALPALPDGLRVGPPIARPGKVVGIGLNYKDHAAEVGVEVPDEPVVFLKASTTVSGPYDQVRLPPGSTATDYEVELGVVVGRRLRHEADPATTLAAVAGYVTANDVTERHRVAKGPTWAAGKCADIFTAIGPCWSPRTRSAIRRPARRRHHIAGPEGRRPRSPAHPGRRAPRRTTVTGRLTS